MVTQQIANGLENLQVPVGNRVNASTRPRYGQGGSRSSAGMSRPAGGARGGLEEEDGDPGQQEQSRDIEQLRLQVELAKEERLTQQARAEVR